MKHVLIERKPSTETETEGFMSFENTVLATIERPWIDDGSPGGKPFESCVPAGIYKLIPHTRAKDGREVVALINEDLGVYYLDEDRPAEGGRYLILCHIANWATDVVGCIGPGIGKADSPKGPMTRGSGSAMKKLMNFIGDDEAELEIRWIT